jgi:hypothetical protein
MAEAAFLLHTGWTPEQYDGSPDDVVHAMEILLNAQADVARNS